MDRKLLLTISMREYMSNTVNLNHIYWTATLNGNIFYYYLCNTLGNVSIVQAFPPLDLYLMIRTLFKQI